MVRHLTGEGDVEDGEPGAGVGHDPQQTVRGNVLDVERVETLTVSQAGPHQVPARLGGEEASPGSRAGTEPVGVEVEDQSAQPVPAEHGQTEAVT